jgi:hypothetical protein
MLVEILTLFSLYVLSSRSHICGAIAQAVNADFSWPTPGFTSRVVDVGCGVNKVALRKVSLRVLSSAVDHSTTAA